MPYGHLIAATVMTFGVCQDPSSIASFSILTSASRSPSAIAEFLVSMILVVIVILLIFTINLNIDDTLVYMTHPNLV